MVAISQSSSGNVAGERLGLSGFVRELVHQFLDDEVSVLAKSVAYNLIFAIPPMLILVIILAGILNNFFSVPIVSTLKTFIAEHVASSSQAILNQLVDNAIAKAGSGALSTGLIVSIVLALYGASGGVATLTYAFNKAYGVKDTRSLIQKMRSRFGLTLLVGLGLVLAFVLLAFGGRIGQVVASRAGYGDLFTRTWNLINLPFAAVLVLLLLTLLYYLGPVVSMSFRWSLPGAATATVSWILAILGFRLYLSLFNPGSAYGATAGAIAFLFVCYVTGVIFIVGAEVNAILQPRHDARLIAYMQAQAAAKTTAAAPPVSQVVAELQQRLPFRREDAPEEAQSSANPHGVHNREDEQDVAVMPQRHRLAEVIGGAGILAAVVGSAVVGRHQRKAR